MPISDFQSWLSLPHFQLAQFEQNTALCPSSAVSFILTQRTAYDSPLEANSIRHHTHSLYHSLYELTPAPDQPQPQTSPSSGTVGERVRRRAFSLSTISAGTKQTLRRRRFDPADAVSAAASELRQPPEAGAAGPAGELQRTRQGSRRWSAPRACLSGVGGQVSDMRCCLSFLQ